MLKIYCCLPNDSSSVAAGEEAQVNPKQLMASAIISPNKLGKLFIAGKYACMWGLCQWVIYWILIKLWN